MPGSSPQSWYEANPAQQGLWVLDRVEGLRLTSLIPAIVGFTGQVDHTLLVSAVQQVLDRHPALRSRFRLDARRRRVEYTTDAEPAQAGFLDALAARWSETELGSLLDALCYTPFDLAAEPPVRAEVLRTGPEETLLVLTVHHIVCDGWSHTLLLTEIRDTYRTLAAGGEPSRKEPPHPSDVVTMLSSEACADRVSDVVERLEGAPFDVTAPFRRDSDSASLSGASMSGRFDAELTEALLDVAGEEGCTPFMIGVALFAGTLVRSGSAQRDFLFAFGWPGRDDPATAEAVGMFMNTTMLRVTVEDDVSWRELLRHVRLRAMEAYLDADVPLQAVTRGLKPDREVMWPPLSPVLVNLHESPEDMDLTPDVRGELRPLPALHMKYDLGLFVAVAGAAGHRRLELSVDYKESLYDREGLSAFLLDMRRSAVDLTRSLEAKVNDQPTTPDLTTPDARIEFVRALWQEVLETDDVAEDLGFFDAGGDSLRLVMLVERMSQESGRAVGTMDLFRAGTVRGHAEVLAGTAAAPAAAESSRDRLLRLAKAGAAD